MRSSSEVSGSSEMTAPRPPEGAIHRQQAQPALLHRHDDQPRGEGLERQARAGVGRAVELGGRDVDRHRGNVVVGDRPLHEAQIAGPERAHRPRVPRLGAQPAQRGQSVGALVEGAERAAGAEGAAHALDDDLQPPLGQEPPEQQADELTSPVGRADEHGGRGPVGALAGDPAVGQQQHAVVHRRAQVAMADDVARLRPRQPHPPRQDAAGEGQPRFRALLMGRGSHGRPPTRR